MFMQIYRVKRDEATQVAYYREIKNARAGHSIHGDLHDLIVAHIKTQSCMGNTRMRPKRVYRMEWIDKDNNIPSAIGME